MEIYGTLGPSCGSREVLAAMFRAGMTGIRLNLSHVTLEESRGLIKLYHEAARDAGVPAPDLLVDMQGPELRIGRLEEPLRLEEGDLVRLSAIQAPEEVMPYLLPGRELLLDDGKILLSVLEGGE
nr:pyruvate kinase [Clostridium sp.]